MHHEEDHEPTHLITRLLDDWAGGETQALGRIYRLLEIELRAMARRNMLAEGPGHILQPTALLNEVVEKLIELSQRRTLTWQDRDHFLGAVARQMQRTLVDDARARTALKRGGGVSHESLSDGDVVNLNALRVQALDHALDALHGEIPQAYSVFMYREVFGFPLEKVASLLGVSRSTVLRRDDSARTFLRAQLQNLGPEASARYVPSRPQHGNG